MNTRCVNPFEKENHKVTKGLVNVPRNISEKYPSIPEHSKICVACKLDFTKQKEPTNTKKCKFEKVECNDANHIAGLEVLEQMKEKFSSSEDKRERILLLTLAPKFWSRNDLVKEFGCTEWEARRAKGLVLDRGILSWPDKKRRKTLSPDVIDAVKAYYNRDDNSRLMPGMNDYISLKNSDGKREHVQKRLLLCNMNELYSQFIQEYPDKRTGISKFTQLRPKHCVIAGSSGTHVVCVCVHHENVKLMLDSINIGSLTKNSRMELNNYQDCLQRIVCPNSSPQCFLLDCLNCSNPRPMRNFLLDKFEENDISVIKFGTWTHTDRCSIVTESSNTHEFLDLLCERLMKLETHDFIARQQSALVKELKINLQPGQFIVCFDFAENYAFGACDGIGANLKRGAKQASLQYSSQHHILTPQSLFEWAKKYCKETEVFFSGKEVYEQVKDELKTRFDMNTDPIPGTLQPHAFIPTSDVC
ncbi:hypothetical protein QAD02_003319 [Eretmocerus hayati]|uniref:Uncharacterized protein n=1 Tax=Eretmocerus hayati TaxID=131215 RepID=A0ACC2NR94_9HYME|nr:hypothetical protein QAD02_003319 [Eretmocerus hayati]